MPELFPNAASFVLCVLIVAAAQLIYATVGFGAGMFSIGLLAIVLPDLAGAVATLLVLTFVTEASVLLLAWRDARVWLLLGLLPTTALGMWVGTELLVAGSAAILKRALGLVLLAAGTWFLFDQRYELDTGRDNPATTDPPRSTARRGLAAWWWSLPAGLAAGTLAGLFGTGGPPVIILLRAHRLDKGAFRATLLWFFLLMSVLRTTSYVQAGVLTADRLLAAVWLLPASVAGMALGMIVHRRLSERQFAAAVSVLLMILGGLLLVSGGKGG